MTALAELSDQFAALTATTATRVVAVRGEDGGQVSGIIWRSGLVVTAHEALAGDDDFEVLLPDGSTAKAELAGRDPSTDVALLKLITPEFGDWPQAATPAVGSLAFIIGRSETSALSGFGAVSEVGPAWRSLRGGEIDARITLGLRLSGRSEGGAVVAANGSLIGLAVTGVRRRAIVIPASTVERAVKVLAEKGYIPRGYLGVSLHPMGKGAGAIIVGLEAGGPAEQAGLVVGDIITTWGGETVKSVADVSNRLATGKVGETIKLGVLRGGNETHVDAVIGERPRG
jgi:S1-C subfamily serine protease